MNEFKEKYEVNGGPDGLDLSRVLRSGVSAFGGFPGPFTTVITAKQMFSEEKEIQEGFVQFQQLRDLGDPTLRPSERKHYSESPCLWTAATVPFLVAALLVSIAE